MTLDEFMKRITIDRKRNAGRWWEINERVEGRKVTAKVYNRWVQILRVEGCSWTDDGPMDCKVSEFNAYLRETVAKALKESAPSLPQEIAL